MSAEQMPSLEDMLEQAPQTPETTQGAPAPSPAPAAETGDKTSTAPPADAKAQQVDSQDASPHVPRKALEDERRKRQDLERRLSEYERAAMTARQARPQPEPLQPQAPPDPVLDPDGFVQYQQALVDQHVQTLQRRDYERSVMLSEQLLRDRYEDYDEVVQYACEVAQSNPDVAKQILNHPLPGQIAYQLGKKYKLLADIGDNPAAYREALEAEFRAKYGIQVDPQQPASSPKQPQPQPASKRAPVPRSLAGQVSQQPRDERGRFSEHTPLEDLIP